MPRKIVLILFIFSQFFLQVILARNKYKTDDVKISNLDWTKTEASSKKENLMWEKVDLEDERKIIENAFVPKKDKKKLIIKAFDRSVTINQLPYPEISHYVPNGYVEDPEKFLTTSLRTISKLRFCDSANFDYKCADGLLNLDFNLINTGNYSFNSKFTLQSISSRGTSFGEESSLGFKLAKEISPKWSLALGGENLIHFDDSIDLGRNFYIITSTYKKLDYGRIENPAMLFINVGFGSDFYGYKGNGFLGRTSCFGKPNLTGDGTNTCTWGPIGSVALALNDRVSLINEWFGYGYGSGVSIKPFSQKSLIFSIYATDYIKDFPVYAEKHCPNSSCSARFYGNLSFTF